MSERHIQLADGEVPDRYQNPVMPPKVDRPRFFNKVKYLGLFTSIKTSQVLGIDTILNEWEACGLEDLRWLSYMLGTAYHETAYTMQPIREYGRGKGRPYGKKIKHSGVPYTHPDRIYYGRGYVQLTWFENYELMSRLLNIDLMHSPDLACDPPIAVKVMFEGMLRGASSIGDFTGKCLEQYFNDTKEDWVNARRIINGLDKAETIAGYGKKFYQALS